MKKRRQNSRINKRKGFRGGNKMARTKGAKNKPTLSIAERLQKANAELTELQEAVKAKKAEIKELKREEKSEAQQVIMKAIQNFLEPPYCIP